MLGPFIGGHSPGGRGHSPGSRGHSPGSRGHSPGKLGRGLTGLHFASKKPFATLGASGKIYLPEPVDPNAPRGRFKQLLTRYGPKVGQLGKPAQNAVLAAQRAVSPSRQLGTVLNLTSPEKIARTLELFEPTGFLDSLRKVTSNVRVIFTMLVDIMADIDDIMAKLDLMLQSYATASEKANNCEFIFLIKFCGSSRLKALDANGGAKDDSDIGKVFSWIDSVKQKKLPGVRVEVCLPRPDFVASTVDNPYLSLLDHTYKPLPEGKTYAAYKEQLQQSMPQYDKQKLHDGTQECITKYCKHHNGDTPFQNRFAICELCFDRLEHHLKVESKKDDFLVSRTFIMAPIVTEEHLINGHFLSEDQRKESAQINKEIQALQFHTLCKIMGNDPSFSADYNCGQANPEYFRIQIDKSKEMGITICTVPGGLVKRETHKHTVQQVESYLGWIVGVNAYVMQYLSTWLYFDRENLRKKDNFIDKVNILALTASMLLPLSKNLNHPFLDKEMQEKLECKAMDFLRFIDETIREGYRKQMTSIIKAIFDNHFRIFVTRMKKMMGIEDPVEYFKTLVPTAVRQVYDALKAVDKKFADEYDVNDFPKYAMALISELKDYKGEVPDSAKPFVGKVNSADILRSAPAITTDEKILKIYEHRGGKMVYQPEFQKLVDDFQQNVIDDIPEFARQVILFDRASAMFHNFVPARPFNENADYPFKDLFLSFKDVDEVYRVPDWFDPNDPFISRRT